MRATHCQGSHASLAHGIHKHAYELHDRHPHLEDEEHFRSIKCRNYDELGLLMSLIIQDESNSTLQNCIGLCCTNCHQARTPTM